MFRCVNVYENGFPGLLLSVKDFPTFPPMLLNTLREEVLEANLELVRRGLVLYTFGNVSGIDRGAGLVAIKPSGVPYEELTAEQIVISDLAGKIPRVFFRRIASACALSSPSACRR